MKDKLNRYSGISLALAGVFTLFINAVLTPLLPTEGANVVVFISDAFLWR